MSVVGFDPTGDFAAVVDGLEAVTLNRRGSSEDVSVDSALQRAVRTSEVAASDGKYLAGDVRWHLALDEVPDRPTPGDLIVDGNGDRWTILTVREDTLTSRWLCVTRNLSVTFGLDDTIQIEIASWSKGTAGADEASWTTWRTGVRARIQPAASTAEVVEDAKKTEQAYTVFLGEDLDLTHAHRLVDSRGKVYRFLSSTAAEEIGQLQTVDVEVF